MTQLVTTNGNAPAVYDGAEIMERVLLTGDLAKLTPAERVHYYNAVCDSLQLNKLTKPFDYITLNGKLTLYATRGAADQFRRRDGISISEPSVQFADGLVIVTVTGRDRDGRTDSEIGAVPLTANMAPDARANAIMKAITKAKRRLTLSMCGLGWLDETEVETIPTARPVKVNADGEIVEGMVEQPPKPTSTAKVTVTAPTPPAPKVEAPPSPPLKDDELVISETAPEQFLPSAAALLAVDVTTLKTHLKSLGYTSIPRDTAGRLALYRKAKATLAEIVDAAQEGLFEEPATASGSHYDQG